MKFISETMHAPDAFSVREIFVKAWESVKKHWLKAALLVLINVGLYFSQFIIVSVLLGASASIAVVVGTSLGIFLCQVYFSAVSINLFIHAGHEKYFLMSQLFIIKPRTLISYAIVSLCLTFMVAVGFIFLFIPGVYMILVYGFSGFFIIDKGLGPFEALAMSKRLFKPHLFNLFQYGSVSFCVLYLLIMPAYAILIVQMLVTAVLPPSIDATVLNIALLIPVIILMCGGFIAYVVLVIVVWFGAGHIYQRISRLER